MKKKVQVNHNSVGKQKALIKKKKEKYIEIFHIDNCSLASMNCLLFQIISKTIFKKKHKKKKPFWRGAPNILHMKQFGSLKIKLKPKKV